MPKLLYLYPDEEDNLSAYEEVIEKLRLMAPVSSDIMLVITIEQDTFEDHTYANVSGKDLNPDPNLPYYIDACALEFTPWNQWLGLEITEDTLADFTELEILCHSLYEMTFIDFDEESIQGELGKIKKIKEEYENMSEEEKKKYGRPIEDFLNELENDEPEN